MMTGQAVITYIALNGVIAAGLGAWIYEPARLALKEMGRRQTLIWLASTAVLAAFYWLGLS